VSVINDQLLCLPLSFTPAKAFPWKKIFRNGNEDEELDGLAPLVFNYKGICCILQVS
jgi:hypothetical protein